MKSVTSMTIDTDILTEIDARGLTRSNLVNKLLREYLEKNDPTLDVTTKKLQKELSEIQIKKAAIQETLNELEREKEKKKAEEDEWKPMKVNL